MAEEVGLPSDSCLTILSKDLEMRHVSIEFILWQLTQE